MFSTFKQRLLLGAYIFVLLSIPIGAYLTSQYQTIIGSASEKKAPKTLPIVTPKPVPSPARNLLNLIASDSAATETPAPEPSSPTIPTSYGPTLSFKINIEGRPKDNQTAKVFVGIADGSVSTNPKFLLSFSVDVPASGVYSGLSLAGLNPGSTYTAVIKGPAQIAQAVSFSMSPAVSNLNDGTAIILTSGDLNDDNVVNASDYSIAQKAAGSTIRSTNWNENADINKDGIINTFDLGIISRNIGKTGATGAWTSPIPKTGTASAGVGGYWIWVPK